MDDLLQGKGTFDVLFEPTDKVFLDEVSATRDHVLITTLDNVQGRLQRLALGENGWTREEIPLPGL